MFFRKMAGRITGDRHPIGGAEYEPIHRTMRDRLAKRLTGRITIRGIVRNADIEATAVGVIKEPQENRRVGIVLGIVMAQRRAKRIARNGPAIDALSTQRGAESLELTAAHREIVDVLRPHSR